MVFTMNGNRLDVFLENEFDLLLDPLAASADDKPTDNKIDAELPPARERTSVIPRPVHRDRSFVLNRYIKIDRRRPGRRSNHEETVTG